MTSQAVLGKLKLFLKVEANNATLKRKSILGEVHSSSKLYSAQDIIKMFISLYKFGA